MRQIPDKRSMGSTVAGRTERALPAETLSESAGRRRADTLADLLADTPDSRVSGGGRTIAGYVPFGREPGGDLPELLARLLPTATILLPVVLPDRDLDWAAFRPGDLTAGEPAGQTSALREPPGLDSALQCHRAGQRWSIVPALAVDRHGNRLGRGGGSYDRALARVGPDTLTVALLHTGELLDELPGARHTISRSSW